MYNVLVYRRCVLATIYSILRAGGVTISTTVAICSKSKKRVTDIVTVSIRTCQSTVDGTSQIHFNIILIFRILILIFISFQYNIIEKQQ